MVKPEMERRGKKLDFSCLDLEVLELELVTLMPRE